VISINSAVRLQLGDGAGAAVAQPGAQPADELVQNLGHLAAIGHDRLDALRHDLVPIFLIFGALVARCSLAARRPMAAPNDAMPRMTLTFCPSRMTGAPGASSQPAKRLPIITARRPRPTP
jgi:hypothetical protein